MTTVLVLRVEDEFSRRLSASGLAVINCPVIATEPVHDLSGLRNALGPDIAGIFVTSAAAARILGPFLAESDFAGRVLVLGGQSYEILKDTGAKIVFHERANSANEMLDALDVAGLAGKSFVFVCGDRSLGTIRERVGAIANLEELIVYRTVDVEIDDGQKQMIRNKLTQEEIGMTCFFSPSGVESFVRQVGVELLRLTKLGAVGSTSAAALHRFGCEADIIATSPQAFAEEVINSLRPVAKEAVS